MSSFLITPYLCNFSFVIVKNALPKEACWDILNMISKAFAVHVIKNIVLDPGLFFIRTFLRNILQVLGTRHRS